MGPRSDITVTFESPCDAEHRCGRCEDCALADEDDDAPSADDLREHDRRELERCVRESLR